MDTKEHWDVYLGLAQFVAVIVGGLWVYFRFRRERPNKPRIEFRIRCTFLGPHKGQYVAALTLTAANRGYVEHQFPSIKLRVRGLRDSDALTEWTDHEPRLCFPCQILEDAEVVPKRAGYYFVRPGVEQEFAFATHIDERFRFIVAHATFWYPNGDYHTVEGVFDVSAAAVGGRP